MILGTSTWTDVADVAPRSVLAIPLGSTEQHGPHLPLHTDTAIAVALAERLADCRPDVVVAPALPYGSSGEHAGFAGTLSIGQAALEHVVVELVRSADAFAAVLLISAHGGNAEPLRRAVATLRTEGRRVRDWSPRLSTHTPIPCDLHAGRTETSLLLALLPTEVRLDKAAIGDTRSLAELLPLLRDGGVRSVSPNGVLGDPTGSAAAEGQTLLDLLVDDLVAVADRLLARV